LAILTGATESISLHLPWDLPDHASALKLRAKELGIRFDAVNSNTFQDQPGQNHSYKFGSLQHNSRETRLQAIQHNLDVLALGYELGAPALVVWLADGTSYPGQGSMRQYLLNVQQSLSAIYKELPATMNMLIEYKPFEPNFYSTTIPDWGTSAYLANTLGERALTLVDLGHHLPNTNIEQVVATLLLQGKLGGFHFNDSKYADDDLTVGCIKPYQLFLIMNEMVEACEGHFYQLNDGLCWMIDASHNIKDPLEDLMQSFEAIMIALAQALLVDRKQLKEARNNHDAAACQEILQQAFRCDVRPLVAEARLRKGGAYEPITCYREASMRCHLIKKRGSVRKASGL
jgi:L-rhamnose isomerase/sugar isomerase